jgi:chitodextrinase
MKKISLAFISLTFLVKAHGQVDTSYIYNNNTPYGALDIRVAKSAANYYYLDEGSTFSFRENSPGVRTNTFLDMTSWDSSPYEEGNLREKNGSDDDFVMNYRLLKPAGYDAGYSKGYPLIIMFHGSGEHGNCWHSRCYHATPDYSPVENNPAAPTDPELKLLNNDHSLLHGGKVYLDAVNLAGSIKPDNSSLPEKAFPGFILFPQNLAGWSNGSVQDALRILRLIVKKYNIDEDRIYINGLSHGAHGVFEAVKRAPWMFSAVVVMSAVDDGFITAANMESTIAGIPMWYFQGELDITPYPAKTKGYITKFRNAGAVVRYTEYPGVGHTTWNLAYKEPDFFTWMLGQRKSQLHSFAGSASICSGSSGLELRLPEGHLAYQWQKNGQNISGADSYIYMATSPGVYRGRFSRLSSSPSEGQWTEWSQEINATNASTPQASINQIGTVLLRDLNNSNTAHLESTAEAAHYYWYKDGNLLNLPGDQDDTVRLVTINAGNCSDGPCSGNGLYTLVTSSYDQCKSEPSEAKHVYFSNQAPTNITAPSGLGTSQIGASTITLTWNDNSSNENGFEIWRRSKNSEGNLSAWSMATLTATNTETFTDSRLIPSTEYHYKLRAVSNSGRSDYFPGDNTVIVSTAPDTQAPTAPTEFKGTRYDYDKVRLQWRPATDDSDIAKYIIQYEGIVAETTDTVYVTESLALNTRYNFSVRAVDLSDNEGPEATTWINSHFAGLYYEHSPGAWPYMDSIDWSIPEYKGYIDGISLRKKTQEDYFYFRFKGYLFINSGGTYQFRTSSDDGSRLFVNGQRVVNNDGIHEWKTITGPTVTLQAGAQKFQLDFFDYTTSDTIVVEYKGPDSGGQWQTIPNSAFKSSLVVSTEPTAGEAFIVNVYPNPAVRQDVNVVVYSRYPEPIRVTLFDPLGKIIEQQNGGVSSEGMEITLTGTQALNAGWYIIRVEQGNKHVSRKIILQNN